MTTIRRWGLAALAALALTAGIAACGESGAVEDALQDARKAAADQDFDKFCDSLSKKALEQAGGDADACAKLLESAGGDEIAEDAKKDFEIKEVEVDGDKATVTTQTEGKDEEKAQLIKEDGDWKIEPDED